MRMNSSINPFDAATAIWRVRNQLQFSIKKTNTYANVASCLRGNIGVRQHFGTRHWDLCCMFLSVSPPEVCRFRVISVLARNFESGKGGVNFVF